MKLPLISGLELRDTIAWHRGQAVSAARFLNEVRQLAACLPAGTHLLNVCRDRYHFLLGFAAGVLAGKISMQPSSQAPETVRQLQEMAPDLFCLHDGTGVPADLPQFDLSLLHWQSQEGGEEIPTVPEEQVVAKVFTSGSTGLPVPHAKTWGKLVLNARAGAERLASMKMHPTIVGTVPPQHMFGFEMTVLSCLHGACVMSGEHPYYPADIVAALERVPQPRWLVTTPFHLRALLAAELDLPPLAGILCSTAPLSEQLARQAENALRTQLTEIYGSTETGQTATRRTAESAEWQLLPGITFAVDDEGCATASGGHIEKPIVLSDILELRAPGRFLLHGRQADLVNIAGKRTSLAFLNHQLNAIDGVVDGCFYFPDEAADSDAGITRLGALVVAPGLSAAQIQAALRQRVDAIFLPRPLHFVECLPRNAAGKLPREQILRFVAGLAERGAS